MTQNKHEIIIFIWNWVLSILATSSWWIVRNINIINEISQLILTWVSIISFIMLIIINKEKVIKSIRKTLDGCSSENK